MSHSVHLRTHLRAGIIVYGTPTCPWTVKQRAYLDKKRVPYEFVDCTKTKCPAFVEGYPTLVLSGYTEIPIPRQ
jgi:hypothetical protein